MIADCAFEIRRPVHHGRQTLRRGQTQPHDRGLGEVAPLDDGIGEMSGADDHQADIAGAMPAAVCTSRSAAIRPLVTSADVGTFTAARMSRPDHDHGIRVGAAHVDADPYHVPTHRSRADGAC
jgi:hypothetical protein